MALYDKAMSIAFNITLMVVNRPLGRLPKLKFIMEDHTADNIRLFGSGSPGCATTTS